MGTDTPLRAWVYGRQSRNKAKSIDEQIDECTADAQAHGVLVAEIYQDGTSASRFRRKNRENWERVLSAVDSGQLDMLVLWASDRGDRDAETWLGLLRRCRDRGVLIRITSHDQTYDMRNARHWETLAQDGIGSAVESEKLSGRVKRGQAGAARNGRPSQGRCPYGYAREREYVVDPEDGKLKLKITQVVDPTTAPVAREIIERVAKSVPISVITTDLNARNVPTIGGAQRWYRQRVRDIATNPVYIGKRVYTPKNGQRIENDGQWPPIVDRDKFDTAQRLLGARVTTRPGAVRHLLSYLATTPCGGEVCAVRGRYKCIEDGCVTIVQDDTDRRVTEVILRRVAMPDIYSALRQAGDNADREVMAARAEAAKLRGDLDGWRRSAARGQTSPESLAVIEADLTADIRKAEQRERRAGIPPALRQLLEPGADVRARWKAMTMSARRDVIRDLATVKILPATSPGSRTFEPERVLIRRNEGSFAEPD